MTRGHERLEKPQAAVLGPPLEAEASGRKPLLHRKTPTCPPAMPVPGSPWQCPQKPRPRQQSNSRKAPHSPWRMTRVCLACLPPPIPGS